MNISLRYAGYIEKEHRQVEAFRQAEDQLLPQGFDYMTLDGLRIEARQKLTAHQPRSLGEASRISGVSPGDVTVLMVPSGNMRARRLLPPPHCKSKINP